MTSSDPTRRAFLRELGALAASGGALTVLPGCADDDRWAHEDIADDATFADGVVAGRAARGAILIVQVEALAGTARLGLEIARDAGLDDVVIHAVVDVPAREPDVPLRVVVDDPRLEPGRDYHYRFVTHGARTVVGRFRVARADDDATPVRLGFYSCQGWQAGYFTSHAGLAAEPDLDVVVSLGDYIYELTDDVGPDDRVDTIGVDGNGFAETLADYRQKYRHYRSDPDLQASHARHAMLAVWDNHELADDSPGHLGPIVPRVALAERKASGMRAFWEFQPMDEGAADAPLYRAIRVGAHVELLLLDLHSYADPPATGGSYLGAAQRAWLFERLEASTARWKLICTSTVMMGIELTEGSPVNTGQWDGFPEERAALVQHVLDRGIGGVVALSGDLHTFLAAPVTTTGRADGVAGIAELSVGAISSEGLFDLRPDDTQTARGLEAFAMEQNPHLVLIEILSRGYGIVEATADELICTLRAVGTVHARTSEMRDLARFRVAWPGPSIERLD